MRQIVFTVCLFFVLMKNIIAQPPPPPPPPPPPMKTYPLAAWKEFNFADDWFSVSFPTQPKESKKTESVNGVAIEVTTYEVRTGDGSYTVIYTKLPQKREESEEQVKERLRETLKRLSQAKQYKWVGGKEIQIGGYPGIEFQYELLDGQERIWQRMYSINDRVYRIVSDTFRRDPALKEPQLFHDSFKFAPPPPPPPSRISGAPAPKFMRVSSGVLQENAIKKVEPDFSKIQANIKGAVQVEIIVSEQGKVEKAEVISGHPLLRQACLEAIRQWEFKPTMVNEDFVKLIGRITFNFER
jgi:TonB family protein